MARATDICNKCGHTGHWAKDCDISFDAYYKRTGKADKQKIFLDVAYQVKDFAKAHGARWDPNARKWFVWDRVPDALKEFEPIRKHAYIKPEKTIDGLCKYCFFSFEEGLRRSDSDASACVHCAPKKQPPRCKHCKKFMVSDCWTGDMDDDSIQIIHDCVGNPMMYGGGCSLMIGCNHRPQKDAFDIVRQSMARMDTVYVNPFLESGGGPSRSGYSHIRTDHELRKDSYNAAVKELSAEFPEFEIIYNPMFYHEENERLAPFFGIHFRIGKEYDDEKIKAFARRGICEDHRSNAGRGYLPEGFKVYLGQRMSSFKPWKLVKDPSPPGCYKFVTEWEMQDFDREGEIPL